MLLVDNLNSIIFRSIILSLYLLGNLSRAPGYYSDFIVAVVNIVENIMGIDDNITIPIVSVILTYIGKFILNI